MDLTASANSFAMPVSRYFDFFFCRKGKTKGKQSTRGGVASRERCLIQRPGTDRREAALVPILKIAPASFVKQGTSLNAGSDQVAWVPN